MLYPNLDKIPHKSIDNKPLYSKEHLKHSQERFNEFLQNILQHPQLKYSQAFEVFLICSSKKEFEVRSKEFEKKIKKKSLFQRNITKKQFEYFTNKQEPFQNIKHSNGKAELKISKTIRLYFDQFLSKVSCFENTFAELEVLGNELIKYMDKVRY